MAQPNGRAATPTKVLKKQNIAQPGSPTRALYHQVGLGTWLNITPLNAQSVLHRLVYHDSWYKTPPDWVGSGEALCIDLVHLCLFGCCFFLLSFFVIPTGSTRWKFYSSGHWPVFEGPMITLWEGWENRILVMFRKYGLPLSSCPYRSQKLLPGGNTSRAILTMIFSWGTN